MKNLSEETLNNEFVTFWGYMQEAGISDHYNPESMKAALFRSAAGINEDSGVAYPGALLVHINLVVNIAKRLSNMVSGTFNIDNQSLLKVCLLQHLSKTAMFKLNDNDWEIKNRGINFKFSQLEGRLKSGERSIMYAMQSGIIFNAVEYEAMVSIDRDDDKAGRAFDSTITTIIREANDLAFMIERERYFKDKN